MSHFNTLVFSHTPEQADILLEPFNECVEPDSPYAVFEEDTDAEVDKTTGRKGYWHNPNAKWDWYELGGRWRGTLKLKKGKQGEFAPLSKYDDPNRNRPGYCDRALAANIDFSRDDDAYQRALRRWEVSIEGAEQTPEEKENLSLRFYTPEYYLLRYENKAFYAEYESSLIPYAFVTADGAWHCAGRMGWFGLDDVTYENLQRYVEEFKEYLALAVKQGLLVSMMDLHI